MLDLLLDRAACFIPVLLSLTVHEWAHAWTAWRLGDDTSKMLGRVTLNPVAHIDPVGTLLLPLLGIPFGWAKPVPVNPLRFRSNVNMSIGLLLTAAAGPISNLLLAAISLSAICVILTANKFAMNDVTFGHAKMEIDSRLAVYQFLVFLIHVNVALACFNLLPIPPLDGSRIADAIIPSHLRSYWLRFSEMGPLLLAFVILAPQLLGFSILASPLAWSDLIVRFFVRRITVGS